MKVALSGQYCEDISQIIIANGIEIVDKNPDIIIAFGGDGSLLWAEREFPGIPKLPIRDTRTAKLCRVHSHNSIIEHLLENKLKATALIKLEALYKEHVIYGINDIFLHNIHRITSIRYRVFIGKELYLKEVASDAFGIATPHGSTAYYKSITNTIFKTGIGMAFSNSREHVSNIILPDDVTIRIKMLRGPALLVADNSNQTFQIDSPDELCIRKSNEKAIVLGLKEFMCPECRKLRHMKNRLQ